MRIYEWIQIQTNRLVVYTVQKQNIHIRVFTFRPAMSQVKRSVIGICEQPNTTKKAKNHKNTRTSDADTRWNRLHKEQESELLLGSYLQASVGVIGQ